MKSQTGAWGLHPLNRAIFVSMHTATQEMASELTSVREHADQHEARDELGKNEGGAKEKHCCGNKILVRVRVRQAL